MVYTLRFFPLQNAVCCIILSYLVPVLFAFYTQGVLKLKKNNSGSKRLNCHVPVMCQCHPHVALCVFAVVWNVMVKHAPRHTKQQKEKISAEIRATSSRVVPFGSCRLSVSSIGIFLKHLNNILHVLGLLMDAWCVVGSVLRTINRTGSISIFIIAWQCREQCPCDILGLLAFRLHSASLVQCMLTIPPHITLQAHHRLVLRLRR
jgi:hypothetical protein